MFNFLDLFGPWGWITIGLIMFAMELVLPGVWLMWIGLAAILTGASALAIDMVWQTQVVLFVIYSFACVYLGRLLWSDNTEEPHPTVNNMANRHIGETYITFGPIENGRGKVKVGDGLWTVFGPDCPDKTPVKVIAIDGNRLEVELAESL